MQEQMDREERRHSNYVREQEEHAAKIQEVIRNYAQPFKEDCEKLSRGFVEQLENHERTRMSPDDMMEHPTVQAMQEQSMKNLRSMLAKQGLMGSSAGNKIMAETSMA